VDTQNSWPARLAQSVGLEIRRQRSARTPKWSAQRLAGECAALGADIPRDLITDLEIGRRSHISVAELLAIAAALSVPPLQLLFGVGAEETAEVLPGKHVPAFRAALWFSGEGPLPEPGQGPDQGFVVMPLTWYRDHDRRVIQEVNALTMAGVAAGAAESATGADRAALLAAADRQLDIARGHHDAGRILREQIDLAGYLPPVPGELNYARETPGREPAAADE
jgi:hypothetical protein